jgi:hypothetical protein
MPEDKRYLALEEWAALGTAEVERLKRERGPLPREEPHKRLPIVGPPDPWQTIATFVLRNGRPVIRDLYITTRPDAPYDIPAGGLTTTELRKVRISDDLMHALAAVAFARAGVKSRRRKGVVTRGRKRKSEDDVAQFANEYLDALAHDARAPLIWLRDRYEKRQEYVTREQLRDWTHRARIRGYLTAGKDGRPGAEATDKLKRWNESQDRARSRRRRRGS